MMGNYKHFSLLIHFYLCVVNVSSIYIEKNAYKGISISISETVKEQEFSLEKLKTVLTKSSEFIYHATRKRSYFGEFIISLPSSWTGHNCKKEDFTTEVSQKVDVHLSDSAQKPHLTTKHSRGCGLGGDRIDMPLVWLNENPDAERLAHQFVQQWSIYRYGVFEEKPIREDSCYSTGTSWKPVGCYNTKYSSKPTFENGLPLCSLPSDFFESKELRSSLMFAANSSKALNFCDGSSSFPHNPAMPTLHNILCKGRTVWSVIENSLDFKYGRNLPQKAEKPPKSPMFRCFREEPVHVTFAIQTNTINNLPIEVMTQIGSTLYEFLWNMAPRDSKATLVTFSDKEDPNKPFDLDITNSTELYRALQFSVRTSRRINNVCLSCGLQKALNATLDSSSLPIVVLIAWKSAMDGENPSGIVESIRSYPKHTTLHLILVEETVAEDIPIEIIQTVRSLGGLIYSLPKELVFRASKLLVILGAVVKNPLQVEDRIVVMHEKNYRDVSKNFVDSFITPPVEFGKMFYVMYCSPKVDSVIRSDNTKCKSLSAASNSDSTFKCGEVWVFSDKKASEKKWEYPFSYLETPDPLHCSSVALLLSSPSASSKDSFTLKGWLSEYVVKVPQNALIIYVEITGSPERKFNVTAQISFGPGLKSPVSLELRDNGNGDPDTKSGDGIYSRYFTEFSEKGIYTVTVSAEMSMSDANSFFAENLKQDSKLVQSKTIGFFYVSDPVPDWDILPPNRVADLSVESIYHDDRAAALQWTAPGGNYDSGKATAYEIKYSQQPSSLSDLYFNEDENLWQQTDNTINPNTTGDKEYVVYQFPKTNKNEIYYVALRAVDENNNKGDISNIIQVYFNLSEKEMTVESTAPTDKTKLTSSNPTSIDKVNTTDNITYETVPTTDVNEITSTPDANTTISPPTPADYDFFDKKTIIILSSFGGILLLLIIINIIVCCCCIKKIKRSPKERKLSRKDSLRPPYNVNVAYQEEDRHSSLNSDNFMGVSMSTLADPNDYTAPEAKTKPSQRKYSYHTDKSLQNKAKKDSELGFKLVQTLPAYATSSLSRYAARSREPDTESETEFKSAIPQPQSPSGVKEAHIYPLGVV